MRGWIGIFILAISTTGWAAKDLEEDPKPSGEPVVITVSAQEIAIGAVSSSVTVISREMIEASRAEHVLDLLQEVPFVHISQVGGVGGLTTVTLRGGDPNFTLVMIDGIPVNDPTNLLGGSYDFSNLSTNQIERIEIVRGPFSSLYGSDALGGVIHVISRKGTGEPQMTVGARAGNFGSQEVRIGIAGEQSIWSYGVTGSYFDVDEQTLNDTLNRSSAAAFSSFDFGNQKMLSVTARYTDGAASGFPENGGGPLFSILREPERTDSEEALFGARYQQRQFAANFDVFDHHDETFTPAILDAVPPGFLSLPSFRNDTDFTRTRFGLTAFWNHGSMSAATGASWKREAGNSEGLIAESFPSEFHLTRDTYSGSAEVLYDTRNLHLSFGIRLDDSDGFANETSPRAGISWLIPGSNTRLRGTWGEGYKLPSFFALGDPNIGNSDLLPERSGGWDVGVEQEFLQARMFVSVSWFHNSFRDLIDFSADQFRLVNRREVTSQGFEIEGRVRATEKIQWIAHLSHLDADIIDTTEPLRDRPKWRGGIGVNWSITPKAHLHVRYTAVGDRFDFQIPVPERTVANAYTTLDVAASYEFLKGMTAFLRADNLLDRDYQEFIGFPNPGIYVRAGVTMNFEL